MDTPYQRDALARKLASEEAMHLRALSTWRDTPALLRQQIALRIQQAALTHPHRPVFHALGGWRCEECGQALLAPLWRIAVRWLLRRPAVLRLARRVKAHMGPLDDHALPASLRPAISAEDERNVVEAHLGMIALLKKHPLVWPLRDPF